MKKVIICDDEAEIVDMLEMVLVDSDFEVHSFEKPNQAVEEARRGVDILVTDVRMGGMDGMELARLVRLMQPACRIVMMSGCMGAAEKRRFYDEGAFACIEKPFNLIDVVKVVMKAAFDKEVAVK